MDVFLVWVGGELGNWSSLLHPFYLILKGIYMSEKIEVNCAGCSGISFTGALALLFIGLKLGNAIDWSWGWVLSPLWIPPCIIIVIGISVLTIAAIIMAVIVIVSWFTK